MVHKKILLTAILYVLSLFQIVLEQSKWELHTIDNRGSGADGIKFADVNNDSRLDIVCGWEESGVTKIYIQPRKDALKKNWPQVVVGKTPNVEDAVFADINADGLSDVVSCTENGSQKIFVHINGGKEPLSENNWIQNVLPASDKLMSWMYAEPMELDGKYGVDLIAAGKGENAALGWFQAPQSNDINDWQWFEISKVGWLMSMIKHDMDKDGDMDIVITDRTGTLRACRWLENPGANDDQFLPWKNHNVGAIGLEVMFMAICDLDNDSKKELLVAERTENTLRIYSQEKSTWKETVLKLPQNTGRAKSVEAGDINNDGIIDLIVSTNTLKEKKDGLIWLDGRRINNTTESDWKSISGKHVAKYDKVELMDVDSDGDLDILICEENYGENSEGLGVVWYENPLN